MATLTIEVGPELFRFESFGEWSVATRYSPSFTLAVDARGRVCASDKDYARAAREGAFPVIVYGLDPDDPAG